MNPLHLSARCYRTFEALDVDLPSGCVAVIGPNGAGKSSILNLIDVCLFAERGELAPLLTVGEDDLELTLTFEQAGELYRVRRQYSARGRGKTTCDFEQCNLDPPFGAIDASDWRPLTRESTDATGQLIATTLGLSRTTFRASSFLAQGDGAAFTEAQPRDRKAILAEILGLDVWDRLLDRARTDLRGCEDDLLRARTAIDGLDDLVAGKPAVEALVLQLRVGVTAGERTLADGERELEEAQRQLSAAAVIAEQVRTCAAELRAATDAHTLATESLAAAVQAGERLADRMVELAELAADAERIAELEQRLATMRVAAEAAAEARRAAASLADQAEQRDLARTRLVVQAAAMHDAARQNRDKADHLEAHIDESAECDRCGQTLGEEAARRAAASYRAEADVFDGKAAEIDTAAEAELATIAALREQANAVEIPAVDDPASVEHDLAGCRRAAEQRAALAEKVAQLTAICERRDEYEQAVRVAERVVETARAALAKARETVVDETVLQAKVERWRIAVSEARRLIDGRRADLVRGETQLEQIVQAEQQLAEHRATVAGTQRRIDVLKLAERAFGRDGIPALIVENAAIPQIELEANRILELMPTADGTTFRVELRTQREKKDGALKDTLDVIIGDGQAVRAYETFSGGERTRINLALRLALAGLLAHRRGSESRLLAIDELDGLDAAGMDALVGILGGLASTFDRILVVSHQAQLATAFDQHIQIENFEGRSRIVGDREPVSA